MNYRVIKLFLTKEKEERWLNQMSALGQKLLGKTLFSYRFTESKANQDSVRIECVPRDFDIDKAKQAFKKKQITVVIHQRRWLYLRKPIHQGGFNLYTDLKERFTYYRKLGLLNFLMAFSLFGLGWFGISLHFSSYLLIFASVLLVLYSCSLMFRAYLYKKSQTMP